MDHHAQEPITSSVASRVIRRDAHVLDNIGGVGSAVRNILDTCDGVMLHDFAKAGTSRARVMSGR